MLAAPAAAETGVSSGKTDSVVRTSIDGTTTDRMGNWDLKIADLFANERAGLNRLSEVTGVEPRAENFVHWIPATDGLEIHFAPHQFGTALPETKIVSWAALADLLAPAMTGIMQA